MTRSSICDLTNRRHGLTIAGTRLALSAMASAALMTAAQAAPAIRTGDGNRVPACATPEKLMAFLETRGGPVDPRYRDIARWYRYWGDAWRVRWDYAFFQMAIETNFLRFRRPDGQRGDVHEKQNNFAGIGATGGGVPGDRFPDVKTGVHAQIQHLVVYSGEKLARPIAPRTVLQQDNIITASQRLRRPVTFGDLARRWAADRKYAQSIDFVAGQFRDSHCKPGLETAAIKNAAPVAPPSPRPALRPVRVERPFPAPSGVGGPKPQMLAGPEVLPWRPEITETGGAQSPAEGLIDPNVTWSEGASTEAPTAEGPPPVRTLWSRDQVNKATATPARESDMAQRAAPDETASITRPAAPAPVAGTEPAAQPAAESADDTASDGGFLLPMFRITPAKPQPSKLGGPVNDPVAIDVQDTAPWMPQITAEPVATETPEPKNARAAEFTPDPSDAPPIGEPAKAAPKAAAKPRCRILTASFGGKKTLLVSGKADGVTRLTALTVLDGFESSFVDTYARANGIKPVIVGTYADKDAALAEARTLCPEAAAEAR